VSFKLEARRKREEILKESSEYLATHAFAPGKFLLAKMILRISGRQAGWLHSLCKHDHSKRDADGERVRWAERMTEGSEVRAPPIFSVTAMRKLADAELLSPPAFNEEGELMRPMPDAVNRQSADHRAADLRDIPGALLRMLKAADTGKCGGMATSGLAAEDAHWIMLTMDGAGLTHAENGVRVAMFPGSVQKMNQSSNTILDLVFYKAGGAAEDYYVLLARCAVIRVALCKIFKDGGLVDPSVAPGQPGHFVHLKFMLTADKAGFCHLMGRKNQNYDFFGVFCDCPDHSIYKLDYDPLTHYGTVTFACRGARAHVPEWEALGMPEPPEWTVHCDCCNGGRGRVRNPPAPTTTPPSSTHHDHVHPPVLRHRHSGEMRSRRSSACVKRSRNPTV